MEPVRLACVLEFLFVSCILQTHQSNFLYFRRYLSF